MVAIDMSGPPDMGALSSMLTLFKPRRLCAPGIEPAFARDLVRHNSQGQYYRRRKFDPKRHTSSDQPSSERAQDFKSVLIRSSTGLLRQPSIARFRTREGVLTGLFRPRRHYRIAYRYGDISGQFLPTSTPARAFVFLKQFW